MIEPLERGRLFPMAESVLSLSRSRAQGISALEIACSFRLIFYLFFPFIFSLQRKRNGKGLSHFVSRFALIRSLLLCVCVCVYLCHAEQLKRKTKRIWNLTDAAWIIRIECPKDVFAEFLGFSSGIKLFVNFDEFLLIQLSTWTIFLQREREKTRLQILPPLTLEI